MKKRKVESLTDTVQIQPHKHSERINVARLILNGLLTDDEIIQLNVELMQSDDGEAILEKWMCNVEKRIKPASLFDRAKQVVEDKRKVFTDDTTVLYVDNGFKVIVYRSQDQVIMSAIYKNPTNAVRVIVGQLDPTQGWFFTLDKTRYEHWMCKVQRMIRLEKVTTKQQKRDVALPVQHTRGRSKLFKT